jgi:hypothetical protein
MFNFWSRKNKMQIEPQTKISRTKIIEGVAIPAIIHNSNYFFVDLTVYEDGTVECWELTDLNLFKQKLEQGWVKFSVPNGKNISIHGLGAWKIDESSWLFNKESFYEYVASIIKKLNPEEQNLYKIYERKVNGVSIMEWGQGKIFKEQKRFDHDIFPPKINGESFNLFFKQNDKYFLVNLVVFADNKIQLHRLPEIIEFDFQEFQNQVEDGKILTDIPENSIVEIYGLGSFKCLSSDYPGAAIENKLLEVRDLIEKLNNRPTSIEICQQFFEEFIKDPTVELKEKLKIAYENVPEHQRAYVGDMDTKDTAVRMIIYGDEEIKNWSHYIAAESMGEKLPTINVPKPKDE